MNDFLNGLIEQHIRKIIELAKRDGRGHSDDVVVRLHNVNMMVSQMIGEEMEQEAAKKRKEEKEGGG